MKVAIIGCGAVGLYFASKLCNRHTVELIGRAHTRVEAFNTHGFYVNGKHINNCRFVVASENVCKCDLLILALKITGQALDIHCLRAIDNLIHEGTTILPLMNGVTFYDELRSRYASRVIGGAVNIIVRMGEQFNHVEQCGITPHLTYGTLSAFKAHDLLRIRSLFHLGIELTESSQMMTKLWEKFVFITSLAALGCQCQESLRTVVRCDVKIETLRYLNEEGCAVANAVLGDSAIHPSSITARQVAIFGSMDDSIATVSAQRDEMEGKASELRFLVGSMVEYASRYNIDVPVMSAHMPNVI